MSTKQTGLEDFIIKHKLNQVVMAELLGIGQGTFSEKLNKTRYNKFNDEQKGKLKEYLLSISKEINKLCQ